MIDAVHISGAQISGPQIPGAQVSGPQGIATQISDKAAGILLASVLPAVFWTAIVALVGSAVGQTPAAATLLTVGVSIAAFLGVVVGSLVARQG